MKQSTNNSSVSGEIVGGQLRFAERFADQYTHTFLYVHGIGWHKYEQEARWAECKDGAEVRAMTQLVKDAFEEIASLSGAARDQLYRDAKKMESAPGIMGGLRLAQAQTGIATSLEKMDSNPLLLNTKNGTINLETGMSARPKPRDMITKVTNARFDQAAYSTDFDKFLNRIFPDPELRDFVARQLGSALIGLVREQKLFIWVGSGANGKGTLRDAVLHALGDYAVEVPADILLQSKWGQSAQTGERYRLKGARLAFCSEIAHGAKMDEATMKKLTGGDPVTAKRLYHDPITFDPSHSLFMLTNHLPQVSADDPATWRRILATPFSVVVPADERDSELPERLKKAPEAILAWLWRGWQDYQDQGLNPPESVLEATRKYQEDSDLLTRFLADTEMVTVGSGGKVGSSRLYKTFVTWADFQGEKTDISNKRFTDQMENHHFTRRKIGTTMNWLGISLNSDEHA